MINFIKTFKLPPILFTLCAQLILDDLLLFNMGSLNTYIYICVYIIY